MAFCYKRIIVLRHLLAMERWVLVAKRNNGGQAKQNNINTTINENETIDRVTNGISIRRTCNFIIIIIIIIIIMILPFLFISFCYKRIIVLRRCWPWKNWVSVAKCSGNNINSTINNEYGSICDRAIHNIFHQKPL
jgi:hypothetical protein